MTPEEYRQKHHRCKYCKYAKLVLPPYHICSSFYECKVKDKIISEFFWNQRGIFCTVYCPKEIEFEV